MKRSSTLLAGAALLAFVATEASAACRDEIASLSPGTTTGPAAGTSDTTTAERVQKDGSRSPMQTGSTAPGGAAGTGTATTGTTGQGGGVAKDGSTMPLANSPGGTPNIATSGQDAQAQQRGGQTASQAQGAGGGGSAGTSGHNSPQMMAALDRARTMLQKGDESGCMQAVQEAKRLKQ